MKKRKGWHQVQFTHESHETTCPGCGGGVHMLRRGRVTLLPSGHRAPDGSACPQLEHQRNVMRTVRICFDVGVCDYTEGQLVEALR